MNTEPFRLRVLMAVTAALQEITPANGYAHDLSAAVFRGRDLFGGESDPSTLVSILEPPLPIDQLISPERSTGSKGDWDLLIQGFVPDDADNPTDPAHRLMADVKKRLAVEKKRNLPGTAGTPDPFGMGYNDGKGNVISTLVIGPGVVRPPGDGVSDKAYFWLGVTLKITEDIADPFV